MQKPFIVTRHTLMLSLLLWSASGLATPSDPQDKLPVLTLKGSITVSGLSSGGYMAGQFHLAFSDFVEGAGIIAAGPYNCAQNSLLTALAHCFNKDSSAPDLAAIEQQLKQTEAKQLIAKLSNIQHDKVFLLHGTLDSTVYAKVSDALADQYQQLGADVLYSSNQAFAHLFPTVKNGVDCTQSITPFIGACNYDAAGNMLKHLYGRLAEKTKEPEGQLITINQRTMAGDEAGSLGAEGYLYVPKSCAAAEPCQLHISFHGCKQNAEAVQHSYARLTGLNEWADNNHLVVLYPQTVASKIAPMNPNACWDWWGYTNENYANRQGPQMQAVLNIAKAIGYKLP